MEYISMYKKFFNKDIDFQKTYDLYFNGENAIKFDFYIGEWQAFLYVNPELLSLIEDIFYLDKAIVEIIENRLPSPAKAWVLTNTLINEIRMTNEIEGIASTRKQIAELLGVTDKKNSRFYGLVSKYVLMIKNKIVIKNSESIRDLFNDVLLRDIENENHNNLPDGKIFRKDIVEVLSGGKEIHRGIYDESKIIDYMDRSLKILNDENIPLLIRVPVFHYLFGYIHPFYDGNGRMSRLISSAYLNHKLDIITSLQVSISCKSEQKKYYELFKTTNDIRNRGDLTYFVIGFLEILKNGMDDLYINISDKSEECDYYWELIHKLDYDKKIQEILTQLLIITLFDTGKITIQELSDSCKINQATMRKYLFKIIEDGIVDINKDGKTKYYSLNLDMLDKSFEMINK